MRSKTTFTLLATVLSIAAPIASCHKTRTFTLPDRPMKPSVAFVALYEGERPREVGPVVPYSRIYAGSYAIESGKTGLDARLFFVEETALQEEASARCDDLEEPVLKVACRDRVADCPRDPSACLLAKIRGEGCGDDRLALSNAMKVTEFRTDAEGALEAAPENSTSRDDLELCGPSLAVDCPYLLPGFVVTEGGRYRCSAPSRQRGCTLEVDLSVCGLGRVTGEIARDGTFIPPVPIAGCTSEAPSSGELLSETDSGFVVTCDARRFVASHMPALIGETSCTRRGPTIFNNPLYDVGSTSTIDGFLRGVKFTHFPGVGPRLLFDGTGLDGCASRGCDFRGNCAANCGSDCDSLIMLPDCANANPWDPCTMVDAVKDCYDRCKTVCDSPPPACSLKLEGHNVSFGVAEEPERGKNTISMNTSSTQQSITGIGSMVVFSHNGTSLVAIASRHTVSLLRPVGEDLEEPAPTVTAVDFEIAGIIPLSQGPGSFMVFGRGVGAFAPGMAARVFVSNDPDPLVAFDPAVQLPIAGADAMVELDNGAYLAAALDPPIGDPAGAGPRLSLLPHDGGTATTLALDGAPTAVGAIAGGSALVGVKRASGESALEVFASENAGAAAVATLSLPRGLIPKVMLPDPKRCENASEACITYVGFELDGANRDNGRAVVGLVEHVRGNPAGAKLLPTFIQTASPELTILEIDTERDVLYAIASAANRLTPIRLAR